MSSNDHELLPVQDSEHQLNDSRRLSTDVDVTQIGAEIERFIIEESDSEGNSKDSSSHAGHSHWLHAAFVIVGEIMGTGVMGLPRAMASLGWFTGVVSCIVFALCSFYAGSLLSRIRSQFYPKATSFAMVARNVGGPKFETFTSACVLLSWALTMPYYLMAATNSLVLAFYGLDWCYYSWALILMAIMVMPLQYRTFYSIRWAALVSDAFVVLVLILTLGSIMTAGRAEGIETSFGIPSEDTFLDAYGHFSSFIFAFLGQSMFLEIMADMKQPNNFPKSLLTANSVMLTVYLSTAIVGYYCRGNLVSGFLPAELENGIVKSLVGLMLGFHIVVSYMMINQVFCAQMHLKYFPQTAGQSTPAGNRHFLLLTVIVLCFSYLVANLVPFFATFQNLIGAGLGAPVMFGWPAYFFLKANELHGTPITTFDKVMCRIFLFVFLPFCTIIGVIAAVDDLVTDWSSFGAPFECLLSGYV